VTGNILIWKMVYCSIFNYVVIMLMSYQDNLVLLIQSKDKFIV
jgi:hypothetical protein